MIVSPYKSIFDRQELEATDVCALCGVRGHALNHDKLCPLANDLVLSINVTVNYDPEKLCKKCKGEGEVRWVIQDDSGIEQCPDCEGTGLRPNLRGQRLKIRWVEDAFRWRGPSGMDYLIETLSHRVQLVDTGNKRVLMKSNLESLLNYLLVHGGDY